MILIRLLSRVSIARRWWPLCIGLCTVAGGYLPTAHAETIYSYTNSQGDRVFTDQPTKGAKKIHVDPPPTIPLTPIELPRATPLPPHRGQANGAEPKNEAQSSPPSSTPAVPLVPSVLMHTPDESPPPQAPQIPQIPQSPGAAIVHQPSGPSGSPAEQGHYQSLAISEPRAGAVKAHPGGTIFVQIKLVPELDVAVGDRIRIVIDGEDKVEDSTGHRFMISGLTNGEHTLIALVARQGKNIFQSRPVVIRLSGAAE